MACNIQCPNCHEDFGKDKENPKLIDCGNCGEEDIKNPCGYDTDEDGNEI